MRVSRIRPGTIRPYRCPVNLPGEPSRAGRFLAERYLPALTPEALASHVDHDRTAARAMSIRHIQTIYVPADETCFTLFEAASLSWLPRQATGSGLVTAEWCPPSRSASQDRKASDDRYAA